jgi:hypothetical protein
MKLWMHVFARQHKKDVKQHKKHGLAKKKTERPIAMQMTQIRNDLYSETAGDEIKHDCLS